MSHTYPICKALRRGSMGNNRLFRLFFTVLKWRDCIGDMAVWIRSLRKVNPCLQITREDPEKNWTSTCASACLAEDATPSGPSICQHQIIQPISLLHPLLSLSLSSWTLFSLAHPPLRLHLLHAHTPA